MLRLGRIFFELFAQPPDMHVHRADLAADVVAPDCVEQRLARIYAVGIAHQKLHEVEFLRRQIDRHVLAKRAAAAAVKRDVPADERLLRRLFFCRTGPAQKRPDTRLEFENVERLCEIVVRAVLKAQQLVHILGFGGQHDNGNLRKLPDFRAGLQTVKPGHHQIEHDQIRRFARRQLHGLHAVAAGHDLVAVVFQIEFNALDEQLFIIYNQNFHSLSST